MNKLNPFYSLGGRIALEMCARGGLSIVAEDNGPGIPSGREIFVRGHGLYAVRCATDELRIESLGGGGTRVVAKKYQHACR